MINYKRATVVTLFFGVFILIKGFYFHIDMFNLHFIGKYIFGIIVMYFSLIGFYTIINKVFYKKESLSK